MRRRRCTSSRGIEGEEERESAREGERGRELSEESTETLCGVVKTVVKRVF